MKTKIEIKSIFGSILFEFEKEDNSIKDTLVEAVNRGADLRYANLRCADLGYANLRCADLSNADLGYANLSKANLGYANLRGANLRGAENTPYIPTNLPEGDFVAWKKVRGKIIKLRVLEDSLRSRATTDKCRCNKALVLEIQDLDGNKLDIKEVINTSYAECKYVVGEIVYADKWDEDRWNECSHGIHFFLDRQTAVDY